MSAKYTPIAGYPDGVYNFGPRYDDTSTRASSRSLDAPAPDSPASDFSPPSGFLSFLLSNENENDDIPAPKGARGGG